MSDPDGLSVQVLPGAGDDAAALEELSALLREELLELDIASADSVETEAPDGSKGLAALSSWFVVHLGPAALGEVVKTIAGWAKRHDKTVELSLGGDTVKLTGATQQQLDRALDEWFARHPASA